MMDQPFQLRKMEPGDMEFAMNLVNEEGWNQTLMDWEILTDNFRNLNLVATMEGKPVGTATAINYAGELAWISMVLVSRDYRGMGIGNLLLNELLGKLKSFRFVGLDATPAGKPVYEKLGFAGDRTILRLVNPELKTDILLSEESNPEHIWQSAIPDIVAFDQKIFGTQRKSLIELMIKNSPERAIILKRNGVISGFALGRQGNRFNQVGPVSALNEQDARVLFSAALDNLSGLPVVADIPADKSNLLRWLEQTGFVIQRPFSRMYLHGKRLNDDIENQYAIAGPEFG